MADDSLNLSNLDVSKLKVPDLKKELKQRGLSTTGNKNELVERLQSALKSSASGESIIDDIEEDLLNDDDDEHLDATESVINELDNELEDSPKAPLKRKLESLEKSELTHGPPKKVILNRNVSINSIETPTRVDEKKSEETDKLSEDDKKVVKLSQLSAKERLELRAKKFGVGGITALSDEAKKTARAERFGASSGNGSTSHTKISMNDSATDVEVLKKRAARFGQSVSSVMTELDKQELLEKRKQRFGSASAINGTSIDDKAKARLERFKQPVK